ncbi:Y-family DNA polymerase [Pseudobutyrivibrio xylanivorans]|uniref:DNA polymerase V n=1 Tax=Pseudobutyrivibrio xylanivorans DSM 14809 TaxID=1123012 RepID=A0A1M6L808_PSEXY|nr:DNA methylase [Pseudobutyrivibrio xylanivorans]SHJ67337.1 DNA polymerase V [Pseudobutyrivibrio xylanivorans DSM 14809]
MEKKRSYIAIDLKSFYASCELQDRGLNPLTTNLVVADPSRTEKTICLAVSPSLKAYGIPGRARLFEVVQKVKEINALRLEKAKSLGVLQKDSESGEYKFSGSSEDAIELENDPSLALTYIVAPPRMKRYEDVSTEVFSVYLRYVSDEDIHVYSIDECFIDVTAYLNIYSCSAYDLAMKMIHDVFLKTGITATAGIGTNLYLSKVAMDVVAKHVPADEHGVRIAELDEKSYRELLWCHQPLTDFWRVGTGISKRLAKLGIYTMGDIAKTSINNEDLLYRELGINAELLIDHAWGWEPTEISTIKKYKPQTNSISSGQVLMEPYTTDKARLIVKEMTELLSLDLVRKDLVTKKVELTIGYDRESLEYGHKGRTIKDSTFIIAGTKKRYNGEVTTDHFGRPLPCHAHGTRNLDKWTSSTSRIMDAMTKLYDGIIDNDLLVRRINVVACNLIPTDKIPPDEPFQMDLFTDYDTLEKENTAENIALEKEKMLQKATLAIHDRFGKNAVLKGMNLQDGAMTMKRNKQVGGHSSGE